MRQKAEFLAAAAAAAVAIGLSSAGAEAQPAQPGILVRFDPEADAVGGLTSSLPAPGGSAQGGHPIYGRIRPFTPDPGFGRIRPLTVDPHYGRIRAFQGEVNPLYGRIRAFWGDISPYYGRIRAFSDSGSAFWGTLNPLYGRIRPFGGGDVTAFYGRISAFEASADPFAAFMSDWHGELSARYGRISAFTGDMAPHLGHVGLFWSVAGSHWQATETAWAAAGPTLSAYSPVQERLDEMHRRSAEFWGPAAARQGGFEAWASGVYARHGVNRHDPASLARMDATRRTLFFLDWYDGLMGMTGVDHVDHWMPTVNWSPMLAQEQSGGVGPLVGVLDFSITGNADLRMRTLNLGGQSTASNGHGEGVAGLIAASHDGRGVMGVAPNARLVAWNPFGAGGTARWSDVELGLERLAAAQPGVINLSLGVAGSTFHPDWAEVFADREILAASTRTVFVFAAGNDGYTQTRAQPIGGMDRDDQGRRGNIANIDIDSDDQDKAARANAANPALIVVGSVDPAGGISPFSNRPGDACVFLSTGAGCGAAGALMDRFVVAPGELILTANERGGVHRQSGTSFAAPLVTGAIALLHDRWPWLRNHPRETADIILRSARDLGAPGTDPVYGRGLLDIEAAQSPLDFARLTYTEHNGATRTTRTAQTVRDRGVNAAWEANGAFFVAIERIGATHRDFAIPLSSRLVGQREASRGEFFQSYVATRFQDWMTRSGFTDRMTVAQEDAGGVRFAVSSGQRALGADEDQRMGVFMPTTGVEISSPNATVRFGFGDGAAALTGGGFGLFSDFDPARGGANPLLGFASGGAYGGAEVPVAEGLSIAAGLTEQREWAVRAENALALGAADPALNPYAARAAHVSVAWRPSGQTTLTATLANLDEESGVLGVQSVAPGDLGRGATSRSLTLSGAFDLGRGVHLAAAATVARSELASGQAFRGSLTGTAFHMAATKEGVFGRDRLRVSFAQPLTIEDGDLRFATLGVVDRQTGALGTIEQRVSASAGRRFVAEALYGADLGRRGSLSAFGRVTTGPGADQASDGGIVAGGRWSIAF